MSIIPKITENNIIISFKGVVNSDKISAILDDAEKALFRTDSETSIKKKAYAILVELLQNLFFHTEEDLFSIKNSKTVQLYIFSDDLNYYIKTGNFIRNQNIPVLKKRIDKINSLSAPEIRKKYLEVLQNAKFSKKGGAKLGIIDIARKSINNIYYSFKKVNEEVSYFEIIATINHNGLNPLNHPKTKHTTKINFKN